MNHLTVRLFDFKNHPSGMAPGTCLIHEFTVFNRIINLVEPGGTAQSLVFLFG
jgi:hypothetical protein